MRACVSPKLDSQWGWSVEQTMDCSSSKSTFLPCSLHRALCLFRGVFAVFCPCCVCTSVTMVWWKELEQNAGAERVQCEQKPLEKSLLSAQLPFALVPRFGFPPCHVGRLIMNKSDIFISGQGTLRPRYPFQEKGYLSGVRKANSIGSKRFYGGILVCLIIILVQRFFLFLFFFKSKFL